MQGTLLRAAAEALLLFILWKTVPPAQSVPFLMEFAAQFLLGVCVMLSIRVNGFVRRFLIVLPGLTYPRF